MGKKYLLEIEENKDGSFAWSNFAPYTAPDLERVRADAYNDGYKAGREAGIKDGKCEAWEAAKRIEILYEAEKFEIFGEYDMFHIMRRYTPAEAIDKLKAYEQEKEEQIQVGDEIETPSGSKGYVVNFTDDELVHYVSSEGRFGTMGMSAVSKTGRHFPEIAEVLRKMRENNG